LSRPGEPTDEHTSRNLDKLDQRMVAPVSLVELVDAVLSLSK